MDRSYRASNSERHTATKLKTEFCRTIGGICLRNAVNEAHYFDNLRTSIVRDVARTVISK